MSNTSVPSAALLFVTLTASTAVALPSSGNAPIAHDDSYTTTMGKNLSVDEPGVLDNDTDPESDALTAVLVSSAGASGTLFLYADGSLEYEVANGFVGTDTFTYVANDGTQNSAPATITFTVDPDPTAGATGINDEATFVSLVAAQGWTTDLESFEDPVWPRTPTTAPSVSSMGLSWSANNATSGVTTGSGPAIGGQYGFYQLPHGSYATGTNCNVPGTCTDGWIATAEAGTLRAAGMWIHCNAGVAGIQFILDGDTANPIEFPMATLPAGSTRFFGVVDSGGFQSFEVHETEGKAEDASYIFGDLCMFALDFEPTVTTYGCGTNPAGSLTVVSGTPTLGTQMVFGIDNPLGTQAPGSIPILAFADQPAPGFPCGQLVPGYGMGGAGALGEVLLSLAPPNPILLLFGAPWTGPGTPATIPLGLPANPSFAGIVVHAQGLMVDLTPGASVFLGVTDGLRLELGS
jgi:hypothetical protein